MKRSVEEALSRAGFGLLLVGTDVTMLLEAVRNRGVETARREELLSQLDVDRSGEAVTLPEVLSLADARVATRQLAVVHAHIEGPLSDEWVSRFKGRGLTASLSSDYTGPRPWLTLPIPASAGNGVYLEGDPFGFYLRDGIPVVWMWVPTSNLAEAERLAEAVPGWFFYAQTRSEGDRMQQVEDVDWQRWIRDGFVHDAHLAYRLMMIDRTPRGLKLELKCALDTAARILGRQKEKTRR